MYKYKWFNYHKGRYVNVIRIEEITKTEAQICDEDGDWYNVKIAELRH